MSLGLKGPLFCDVCGRKYFHVSSLALHKKVHEGLTTCVICGKVSSKVANLRRHLENSHKLSQEEIRRLVPSAGLSAVPEGERCRYQCDLCGHVYRRRDSLTDHRLHHLGRTACHVCGAVYSTVRSLRRHLRDVHRLPADEVRRNTELDAPAGPAPL
ncbi:zinc finger protein 83-like [Pollicipes pollicipes]|uniref:zinc finger protein 83-like n=1 Tax=Pollicipes pollicipes TaxID=41117 RepID=UPI0018853C8F|nr:zinc finger protein 83-like [Pollicipes pollicipes]